VLYGVVVALVFAALSVPGNEIHALLFGTEEEEVEWLADLLLDGSVVLAAGLALLVPASLVRLAPWPPDDLEPAPVGRPFAAPHG
jgi:hypothetical protein